MKFFELLSTYGDSINKKLKILNHHKRVQENIDIKDAANIDLSFLKKEIYALINKNTEKLVIRESMWDPVIRVYYDYIEKNNYSYIKENINKLIKEQK